MDIIVIAEYTIIVMCGAFAVLVFIGFPWAIITEWHEKRKREERELEKAFGYREEPIE